MYSCVVLRGLKVFQSLVERESREEDPTTSETEEQTFQTKPRKGVRGPISEHKAIALNNHRQKKNFVSRVVSVENKSQAHSSPEYSESEMVRQGVKDHVAGPPLKMHVQQ